MLPKVTGTHRGPCSASEANGTLQGMGRGGQDLVGAPRQHPIFSVTFPSPHLRTGLQGLPWGQGLQGKAAR